MEIRKDFVAPGKGARPGKRLTDCRGLVIHWIGAAQSRAEVIRKNYEQEPYGTQYVIDWNDGHIIQCMPENEVAYHVGAEQYTKTKEQICGRDNPNWHLVGIECCIGDKAIPKDWSTSGRHMDLGKLSQTQYSALVAFAADFLKGHKLTVDNLYRHYDITGKLCHVWFVKDGSRWNRFKADVKQKMEGDSMTKEEVQALITQLLNERDTTARQAAQSVNPNFAASWEKACRAGLFDNYNPGGAISRDMLAEVMNRAGLIGGTK